MIISEKEQKIEEIIQQITGKKIHANQNRHTKTFTRDEDLKIVITDKNDKEIFCIKKIDDFEILLKKVDKRIIFDYAKKNVFSEWLKNIGEIDIAKKFLLLETETTNVEDFISQLKNIIEDYRYSINQAPISGFSRKTEDPLVKITKIGEGALGGKARGLSFIAKMLSTYISEDMFPGLKITIPRSIVLSTDIFGIFMDHNNLYGLDFNQLSDQRIAAKFMEKDIPAIIIGDLRVFIKNSRKPLIVRSSGLLEDSLMQPFAGIYESVIFPNDSWETDTRFQEICNSIKYVYASTYFEKARTYIKNTKTH